MKSNFETILSERGELVYTCKGDSMAPLIRQRDLVVIEKADLPLKIGDVPLYRRDSGEYVLHRIIGEDKSGYVICGDNRWQPEHGIEDRHIVGVLTAVIRDGEKIAMVSPCMKRRTRRMVRFFPFRSLRLRWYYRFYRLFHRNR